MGRKTYESLPKRPLPNRENIVISRSPVEGAVWFSSLADAVDYVREKNEEAFIIGGQTIYEQSMGIADKMIVTHIDGEYEGNYWFPEFVERWRESKIIEVGENYTIVEYLPRQS